MKAAITKALALIGLAPTGRAARAEADAQRAVQRAAALEDRLASTRAELERWKRRYEEKASAAAAWKESAAEVEAKAKADTARIKAACEKLKTRAAALASQVADFQARLEQADRATSATREELMVVETKLDLLEAAIHVLDARTREGAP